MTDCYTLHDGDAPLLVCVPHDGRDVPVEIAGQMTDAGRSIPDTDWHVTRLYDCARDLGATISAAQYSRYVVDLNRPADD
ncbi:MAG: N-formylglutamate amidohydrolase, partial [Woeseiaceae bacterium]